MTSFLFLKSFWSSFSVPIPTFWYQFCSRVTRTEPHNQDVVLRVLNTVWRWHQRIYVLLTLLEVNPSTLFARFLAWTHRALGRRSELTRTPKSLSHLDLGRGESFKLYLWRRLFLPTLIILHFPILNSICHFPAQSNNLPRSSWRTAASWSVSIILPIFVSSGNILTSLLIPARRSLI